MIEPDIKSARIFKLLIVDDESEIREGINRSIPWADYGITVTGLAKNGREALRLIADEEPDMMLLDIRMPVMNGLEVLEKLPQRQPAPKVVILSGYDDFKYCQQALRSGVADYLLKPCRPQDILAAVQKMREQILAEENEAGQREYLQRQFRENLDLLREKLLIYLIQHETIDIQTALVRWQLYEMELRPQNMGVALVRTDNLKTLAHTSGQELELSKLAVRNLIRDALSAAPALKHIICDYNDDLLVLWHLEQENTEMFSARMERLRQNVRISLEITVTIGLGKPAADPAGLYAAFNSAFLAVEHGFWEGPDRIIHYSQAAGDGFLINNISLQEENAIIQCIRTSDYERLDSALDGFFAPLSRPGMNSRDEVQRVVTALICSMYHVCAERGLNTEKLFGPNLAILDELAHTATLNELKQKIRACLNLIIEQYPSHKNQWKVVNSALKIIAENLAEDLSLEIVAQKVFVSSGYLSTIFKQVLQKNFVDCLHEIRVEKAKELLRDFHAKVYEVSIQVGYKDEKYFSQIFKKITGMTPNQYRDTVR
jgi:Response regulator containing CheY-like receiver domain and AraC-type DNA-binding domain